MNTEAQRIAIAEVCGYRMVEYPYAYPSIEMIKSRVSPEVFSQLLTYGYERIPDYLNDLNAMHEAEKRFHANHAEATDYYCILEALISKVKHSGTGLHFQVANASASHRAEAYLKTLNLWTP